ncbi:hypothetical protein THAOC_17282 [Thalassiosira oceanica]|uniref:Thioredoxin domain-containing protein n=1 Tax=Thalassiosira oceanica TaxID=159749 RepID=K0SA53_THAOC|nr:hypothetical protein THAOC_17282 [Thalassiosira oceanica]|eukprot:EJK62120.1 hypothetical protein THAOC_17282 [Thalassiosira oceanica]
MTAKQIQQRIRRAVFVKVDTNAMYELSNRYSVRSLPTFKFFLGGRKIHEFSGAGEGQLRQFTRDVIQKAEFENVLLPAENLVKFYAAKDPSKSEEDVGTIYGKCASQVKGPNPENLCVGAVARNMVKSLRKKYGDGPETTVRFEPEEPKAEGDGAESKQQAKPRARGKSDSANLHLATKEQLMAELEKRLEAEEEAKSEEEEDDDAEFEHSWTPSPFPERVTIIGGGPAGLSAAIYAARAGLKPVVVAPPMGGQLQGKGVDVENYPGLFNVTGPAVVSLMRQQAIEFGATFEAETVVEVDASERPLKVRTNSSVIETHAVVVATGAESNWLGVKGEYEMRGGGVSSCATCDGHMYRGKDVIVVGGGDTAMEEALVLARTSGSVTVVHRRDEFRASKILAQRVMEHPSISIRWNTVLVEVLGRASEEEDAEDGEDVDLDAPVQMVVRGARLRDVYTEEESVIEAEALFVAIGHTPATSFLEGIVEFNPDHAGYVLTKGTSTHTSLAGVFACGDVSDSVYRQAITSAGSGAAAALDAERWLSEEGLGNEEADFEAELLAELMADGPGEEDAGGYNAYEDAGGRIEGMKESIASEL